MLAIIKSYRGFWHYVKKALFSIQMLIDDVNLNLFFKNKKLNKKNTMMKKIQWFESSHRISIE
jgi:hypothetical protein